MDATAPGNANHRSPATPRIYLDWAATAPLDPAAVEAMTDAARAWANPSSVHGPGRAAAARLDDARRAVANAFDVAARRVVFTGGGTEALGLALAQPGGRTFVSAVEHDAVRQQVRGTAVVPVDDDGVVRLDALDEMLAGVDRPRVAVMHANNETGVIQPIAEVARIVTRHGGTLLVDAVQSAGKLPLPDADYIAVSAHKLGGPPGVGALIVREDVTALIRGGGQERGMRAGTENLPGIAGFAAALVARTAEHGWHHRAHGLRDRLEGQLPGAVIHGRGGPRLGTISCVGLPGVAAMTQLMALDLAGVAVSAGAACSSGKVRTSHVLGAMGVDAAAAGEAIRVSFGWTTTTAEVDAFGMAWRMMVEQIGTARQGRVAA